MEDKCWRMELFFTHFKGKRDLDIMLDTVMERGGPDEVFALVSEWKERGNDFFKKGQFGRAIEQYDMTTKYLLCTWMVSTVNSDHCTNLTVLLHLNMEACALKVGSFQRAFDLCSLVIKINPDNTKARYRRAMAALEVGFTNTAFEDLSKAMSFDPNNKEIQRELGKIVLRFKSIIKEKRKLDSSDSLEGSEDYLSPPIINDVEPLITFEGQRVNDVWGCSSTSAFSGRRDVDLSNTRQGGEEPIVGVLPCSIDNLVIEHKPCEGVTGTPLLILFLLGLRILC